MDGLPGCCRATGEFLYTQNVFRGLQLCSHVKESNSALSKLVMSPTAVRTSATFFRLLSILID